MNRLLASGAACAALAVLPAATVAGPADQLLGTWECRVPGAAPTKTPPIVWFGAAKAEGKVVESSVDLDGFARQVSGISELAAEADGWMRVQPQDGAVFMVRPLGPMQKAGIPAMSLKRGGTGYHCLRLPSSA
jgi:hypothetical protein